MNFPFSLISLPFLMVMMTIFTAACRGDSQVLATYQKSEVTRGMLRDIADWYRGKENAKDTGWQKFIVKEIALTNILSEKAKKTDLYKSSLLKEFETLNRYKVLHKLNYHNWLEKQEKIPEKLYQIESMFISEVPTGIQKNGQEKVLLKYMKELKNTLTNKEISMSEIIENISKEGGQAKHFPLEYWPLVALTKEHELAILKMAKVDPESQPKVSAPIKTKEGWWLLRLKKTSSALKSNLFNYLKKPPGAEALSSLIESYWERILSYRVKNWKREIFQKYGLNFDDLPNIPKNWKDKDTEFIFRNDKISILAKDFQSYVNIFQEMSEEDFSEKDISDKSQSIYEDHLEINIFSKEAISKGFHKSEKFQKIFDWEKIFFLRKVYIKKNWFNDLTINEKEFEAIYRDQRRNLGAKISRDTVRKLFLRDKNGKLLVETSLMFSRKMLLYSLTINLNQVSSDIKNNGKKHTGKSHLI